MFGVSASLKKQLIAIILILSLVFIFVPQKSDGIILAILAANAVAVGTVAAVIIGTIEVVAILCIAGVICGNNNNNNNNTTGGPGPVAGEQCIVENACGMASSGVLNAELICDAVPVPDSDCNQPLNNDALQLINPIVRKGDNIVVEWDTQGNLASNCTIEGPGFPTSFTMSTSGTQAVTNIQSPYRYTLICGDNEVTKILRTVPEIAEQ